MPKCEARQTGQKPKLALCSQGRLRAGVQPSWVLWVDHMYQTPRLCRHSAVGEGEGYRSLTSCWYLTDGICCGFTKNGLPSIGSCI